MTGSANASADDRPYDASDFDTDSLDARLPSRWIGWRFRLLVVAALLGCLMLFGLMRLLVQAPVIGAQWQPDPVGRAVLQATTEVALRPHLGQSLERLSAGSRTVNVDAALLFGSPRWTVDDDARADLLARRQILHELLEAPRLTLQFHDAPPVTLTPGKRGIGGLGLPFWLLAGPALLLYLLGAIVLLARPRMRNLMYAVIALCQAISLVWIGIDSGRGLAPLSALPIDDLGWRLGLDLATAAACVHGFALYPVRLRTHRVVGASAWALAGMAAAMAAVGDWPGAWWWGQGLLLTLGLMALATLSRAYRAEPHPAAAILRRIGWVVLGTLVAVNVAVIAARWQPSMAYDVATLAVLVWTLFFASVLVWVPFLSRSRHLMREFALLAGLSTVATSLDLLFVSLFSLEPFASLTLAVFVALGAYAAARQWIFDQMTGSALLSTERTFEHLYRVARELQKHPERQLPLVTQLLRDLFEPLEVLRSPRGGPRSKVMAGGAALQVPLADAAKGNPSASLVLRFADRGRRLFTVDDARLTDRVVDQLRRAAAYDGAVERGRTEERLRIAQDLHDDIGARLLTLMYKAQDPEMEDYLRHTLLDLKTLTRGLSASEHLLSHAAVEWKTDLQQRLAAADIALGWSFSFDEDLKLSVVQWSALTRVLRELVSNAIYHGHASRVEISGNLDRGRFTLQVGDDGSGSDPAAWSHGLGLGGVRKRVKLLDGTVLWRENTPHGIVCEVDLPSLRPQR